MSGVGILDLWLLCYCVIREFEQLVVGCVCRYCIVCVVVLYLGDNTSLFSHWGLSVVIVFLLSPISLFLYLAILINGVFFLYLHGCRCVFL